ncbi:MULTISPECIES: amino acid ABC transporter substrate-binding protein/permease [unclassified Lactococcus]|uniref:amino acid ABC transporter substrate-binding protein/permease n=1 Tax=unclassified Lactococcus TaxID=2643510 RepID=UPI0011CB4725|nr:MULTISPECIES: amino acid ABC transporter substrate-binding protein/permease [unclassified Lactococcus]MQW22154.1 ABC transporter permease subunit [Lactococcus sp. dk101]TXK45090.1 ABC transporter permease subunit [Lactococcus sp. dk310]TXK51130.1 ABC transporter permease subunit [Lactococcus sp. dk322]
MKKFLLSLATLLAIFTGFSISASSAHASTTVKIASDNSYAPFEFQDSNKQWSGIDVDIMKEVAKRNDWKLEMSFPGFDAALQNLQGGQVDGVIAGMSITDERKKTFDFSEPYYTSALTIATTQATKITSFSELKGKAVGAKNGTASQTWLQDNQKKYGYTIKTYSDGTHMYAALSAGNIVGAMDDYPVISYAIKQGQDLAINMPSISMPGGYGFAVMKGKNQNLVDGFNKAFTAMKADGTYDKILANYIGTTKKATPKKATYTIASDNSFAPFEFQGTDKKYTGIDVDLLNAIAKNQGFTIKWNFIGFQSAVDSVQAGHADGMMSGMTITDARKKVFDYSDAYFSANLTLGVAKTDDSIKSWDDLKGKTVGAKNGTASYDYLSKNASKYGFTLKAFTDATTMYSSLDNGSIKAVMDDEPVIQYAIKQGKQIKTPLKGIADGQYGFAVKKGQNPELIQMFNDGLAQLRANGQYDEIVAKYLSTGTDTTETSTVDETTVWGIIQNNWSQILNGLKVTIELALISFVLALIVGIIFGLFSVSPSKTLRGISRVYVDVNRSLPLLVLTIFLFYGIPNLIQMITGHQSPLNEFTAGVIALTLNESSYIAEIVRGGVKAVPVGQMEASRSLGIPYVKTMRKVILPQAVKITIPSLINQFVITTKDTTLVSVIGLVELLQTGQIIVARNFQAFRVYGIIGVIYMVILLIIMWLGRYVEKKLK